MNVMKNNHSVVKWYERGFEAGDELAISVAELIKFQIEDHEFNGEELHDLLVLNNVLFYIFLDRQATSKLETKDREDFSDGLLVAIATRLTDVYKIPSERQDIMMDLISEQIAILAPFSTKLLPEGDQSPAGTLIWEYCRILKDKYGMTGYALASYPITTDACTQLWLRVKHLFF